MRHSSILEKQKFNHKQGMNLAGLPIRWRLSLRWFKQDGSSEIHLVNVTVSIINEDKDEDAVGHLSLCVPYP